MQHRHLRFPEGKYKAFTMSYDDGWAQDKRFSDIITKHGIKATFNIISRDIGKEKILTKEEIKEYIIDRGHEIAVHGAEHRANGLQRPIGGIQDILNCRLELEKEFGVIVRGMAPAWTGVKVIQNGSSLERIKQYLKNLDIAYVRYTAENDDFYLPDDWFTWTTSTHHQGAHAIEYVEKFVNLKVPSVNARRMPRLMHVWGHTYEFDNNNNWDRLETICQMISAQDDVWCATNMEIYEYVTAYNSLIYSADETQIYNPTLHTIWLDIDCKPYVIKPGETIKLN